MTNFEFLQKYLDLQKDVMFDKIIDLDFSKIVYCNDDTTPYWNYALVNNSLNINQLKIIENSMSKLNRKPAIYFENKEDLKPLIDFLSQQEYIKSYEDSWIFHNGENISKERFYQVKEVENEKDLKICLETYNLTHRKNDPQNPYGELGDYLLIAKKAWLKNHKNNRLEYFIVFKEDKPVAVSALNNFEGIGYLSNIGSLKEVRGQGFGKLATLYAVWKSKQQGNKIHCLATEEGTYPNEFYKRIGFKTKFTGVCFVKEEKNE